MPVNKPHFLLDGVDVGPPKWRVCGRGLNRFVHEGANDISNAKVHLRTRSGRLGVLSKSTKNKQGNTSNVRIV